MLAGCTVYYCLFMDDYHFKNKEKISALFYCGSCFSGGGVVFALYHVSVLAALTFMASGLFTSILIILSTMSFKVFFRTLYFEYILRAIRGKVS
jgi:hypothetical protein